MTTDEKRELRRTNDHEHHFEFSCFACDDQPFALCACGECRSCGAPINFSEVMGEIEEQRKQKFIRRYR